MDDQFIVVRIAVVRSEEAGRVAGGYGG